MAILKRIANKNGDGAGRSRYTLQKAIAVRTDIPSPLSLLIYTDLTDSLKRELADEFNRFLLLHQGNYKTSHYIISFGHFLSSEEIEEVLDRIQQIFDDPDRYHLYVVHQETHGTAIHVVESANRKGQLRRLSPRQFHDLKRQVIDQLSPYMNARELEVAGNYQSGIVTQDWKSREEIQLAEKSWKEYIRECVNQASELIKDGDIEKTELFLQSRGIKIEEVEPGGLSPYGRRIRRKRTYAVYRHPQKGIIAIPLDKKMKATFQTYQNAIQEHYRELEEIERIIEENIPRTKRPETSEGGTGERNRTPGKEEAGAGRGDKEAGGEKEIYIADLDLYIPAEGGAGEGDRETQTGEGKEKDGTFGNTKGYRESGESEKHSFYPDRREEKGTEKFRTEHSQEESGTNYCQPETPGIAKRREETEAVEKGELPNRDFSGIQLGSELLPLHPTPKGRTAYSGDETTPGAEDRTTEKKSSTSENDFTITGEHYPTEEEEFQTPEEPFIPQEEEFTASEELNTAAGSIEPIPGERDYGESGKAVEFEDIGEQWKSTVYPDSREISDIPRRERQLGDSQRPLQDMHPSSQRKWTINGEEITEDDIRGNPALYARCEIEEVRKLAWDYLLEEIDEEMEFLEKMGYFRDIEEVDESEELEIKEAERRREIEEDSGMDLEL